MVVHLLTIIPLIAAMMLFFLGLEYQNPGYNLLGIISLIMAVVAHVRNEMFIRDQLKKGFIGL